MWLISTLLVLASLPAAQISHGLPHDPILRWSPESTADITVPWFWKPCLVHLPQAGNDQLIPVGNGYAMPCHQKNSLAIKTPFTRWICQCNAPNFTFSVNLNINTFMAVTLVLSLCTARCCPASPQMEAGSCHFLVGFGGNQVLECISRQHSLANFCQGLNIWRNPFRSKTWGSTSPHHSP